MSARCLVEKLLRQPGGVSPRRNCHRSILRGLTPPARQVFSGAKAWSKSLVFVALSIGVLASSVCAGRAKDSASRIESAYPLTNLLGARDADTPRNFNFPLDVHLGGGFKGRLGWRFSVGLATIQAQETPLEPAGQKLRRVTLPLRVPYVRPGLVVKGKLAVHVVGEGQRQAAADYEQSVWIFSPQPFADRAEWLKTLKITLFDPGDTTGTVLRKNAIPFETAETSALLADVKEGLILVGEGVSLDEDDALPAILVKAAARGLPVLCLAPARGTFPLPGADNAGLPAPEGMSLCRPDIITRLDERLDARAWSPTGKNVVSGLSLKAVEGSVKAEVTGGSQGWPWLEMRYANRGKLVICGFGIMRDWDAGAAPRYFFARVLEKLAAAPSPGKAK